MAVGGPNSRKDFHHDPAPNSFSSSRATSSFAPCNRAGSSTFRSARARCSCCLRKCRIPRSARPTASASWWSGAAVPASWDGFSWYCENCGHQLYLERIAVHNIETQLPEIFSRFFASLEHRTCASCGSVLEAPA